MVVGKSMRTIKCPYCGKTLFRAENGIIEIKCVRNKTKTSRRGCGKTIKFEITDESVEHTIIRE